MIIDTISDLHGHLPKLEGGDLLIVAGDLTAKHTYQEYFLFANWLRYQDYKCKIFIAGNHDPLIQDTDLIEDVFNGCDSEYLCDSGIEFEGLKIWGSPWTPIFDGINPNCKAFTGTERELAKKFELIPSDTDILITHGPPSGVLDKTVWGDHVGSTSLQDELYSERMTPKLHIFGHIHEAYGQIENVAMMSCTHFVNCSHVDESYKPINKAVRIIL